MHFAVDVFIVVFIVLAAIIGAWTGFIKIGIKLISTVLAFAIAIFLSRPIANFVYTSFVKDSLQNMVAENITEIGFVESGEKIDEIFAGLPIDSDSFSYFFSEETIEKIKASLANASVGTVDDVAENVVDTAVKPILISVMSFALISILFGVLIAVFGLISKLLLPVERLPVIKQANKALGAITGLVFGVFLIFLITYLVSLIAVLNDPGSEFMLSLEKTKIFSFINRINPINYIVGDALPTLKKR